MLLRLGREIVCCGPPNIVLLMTCCIRERILREAQEQQRRAQMEYEEKNKLIITMQNQFKEMQEFQQVSKTVVIGLNVTAPLCLPEINGTV